MTNPTYGSSLKGELFSFVHRVCETELDVSMKREYAIQWTADQEIFAGYLALKDVQLKFPHYNRNNIFWVSEFGLVLDDGDVSLFVDRYVEGDLNGDVWIEDVLAQAADIYDAHNHDECLRLYGDTSAGTQLVRQLATSGEIVLP